VRGLRHADVAAHHPVSKLPLSLLQMPLDSWGTAALRASSFRTRYRGCGAAESGNALGRPFGRGSDPGPCRERLHMITAIKACARRSFARLRRTPIGIPQKSKFHLASANAAVR
jgi:hypothetical protein